MKRKEPRKSTVRTIDSTNGKLEEIRAVSVDRSGLIKEIRESCYEQIERLERTLSSPPPLHEMLREMGEQGWSNGVDKCLAGKRCK